MSSLPEARMMDLVGDWVGRLSAEEQGCPASDLYGGRSFREAAATAKRLDARFMVVSAGLGLIDADQCVPSYACTVAVGAPDSVHSRAIDVLNNADWWAALSAASPFSKRVAETVATRRALVLAALSDVYLEMISDDLGALPPEHLGRVRIFTRAPRTKVIPALQPLIMPYDDRLDGPDSFIRGTRSDFASRALHHFAQSVLGSRDSRTAAEHADAVSNAIANWRMPRKPARTRHDDAALLVILRAHWDSVNGSSSRLLRLLRDDLNIACEQGRFAGLARQVREERA
jgi:hypothetical protein